MNLDFWKEIVSNWIIVSSIEDVKKITVSVSLELEKSTAQRKKHKSILEEIMEDDNEDE